MSLFKRSDSPYWWVKLSVNGSRVQRSTGTADKGKAQEYHDKLKAALWDASRLGIKPRRTWKEAVVRFIAETRHKRSHAKDLAHFRWLDRYLGALHLDEISRDRIDAVSQARLAEKVSNASVNRVLALVRSVLRRACIEWEWIDRTPKVRLLPEPRLRVRYLTPDEARLLLEKLPLHLAVMAEFTLLTGLRQGNVRDLAWRQVDLDGSKLWIESEQAKGGRAIPVPLSPRALQLLRGQVGTNSTWVFTYAGRKVSQVGTRAWRNALGRAGIEDFRWHDLRHTWASWHAQAGTPQGALKELGAWRSDAMVRRYAHFGAEHLQRYADDLDFKVVLK